MRPLGKSDPTSVASYRLLGVLGGGGMGRVYLGQSRSGRRLAIKLLSPQYAEDPEYRERFAREVAAARLVSPLYTAAVVDADPHAESPWLATTFIEGPSLDQWVQWHGKLSPDRVLALAAGLAEALGSIHKVGLVHRDLKPSNVIVNPNGPHIIDFGIALSGDDLRITTSLMVGTPAYMAPERVNGLDAGPPGDVYSLGATLYYAATGSQLITGGSFYEQVIQVARGAFDLSEVPEECRPIVELCLHQSPQDRPTPDELMQVLVGIGVTAPESGWWPELEAHSVVPPVVGRRGLTRRALLVGGSAVAVATVGGGVILAVRRPWATPGAQPASSSPTPDPQLSPVVVTSSTRRIAWHHAITTDGRVMVDRGQRLIASAGPEVSALDTSGSRVWTKRLPTGAPIRLWEWGDAVLAGDLARLWMLDAATGDQNWSEEVAKEEQERSTRDNPDRMTVQIEHVVTAGDLAVVSLGTAMVALNRACKVVWRVARQVEGGRRAPLPAVVGADGAHLVTWSGGRVALRRTANGSVVWQQSVPSRDPAPPPHHPREGGGDEAWQRKEGRFTADAVLVRDGSLIEARALAGGRILWHMASQTPIASFEVMGDLALIGADRLVARRVSDGEQVWEAPLRGARVAVAAGTLVAAHDQGLSTVDPATGRVLWREPFPATLRDGGPERVTADAQHAYVVLRSRQPGGPGPRPVDVVAFRLT